MKSYRSKAVTLAQWLNKHRGQVVQIGTDGGSGFLYAGKAGRFTLDAMRSAYKEDFSGAIVKECRPSFYAGYIVIISGFRSGSAELPRELMPKFPEAPIEHYVRFVDYWVGSIAQNYKTALITIGNGKGGSVDEATIIRSEHFFRSELFSLVCPNADGEEVIHLIKAQARKEIEENERRRKERASKWLY